MHTLSPLLFLLLMLPAPAQSVQDIELEPFGTFLGRISEARVYHFHFGPGTLLTPGTRLNIDPLIEFYGTGSIVNDRHGLDSDDCAVPKFELFGSGRSKITCEAAPSKY